MMKAPRFVLLFLALALFAAAALPVAAQPRATQALPAALPAQSLVDSALGLPLLAPMSLVSLPVLSVSVENASASADYACNLVSQKPKDWTKMQRRNIFDATWTVRNTGTKNWGKSGIDLRYVSGTKMHTYGDSYDLSKDVGPGKSITLIVDMISPKNKGYYTAVWGLYKGNQLFCKLSVTINVNR
ncbi:MAG: hypothetical protein Fur0016_10000 [Anaerolineales bacterium]